MFLVIASDGKTIRGWGRGNNEHEAYAEAYKSGDSRHISQYLVYEVCPGTICETGLYSKGEYRLYFKYPIGELPPKLIKKVINDNVIPV